MAFKSSVSGVEVDQEPIYTDIISITKADLQALSVAGKLKPKQKYSVSNSFHGGSIIVTAVTANTIETNATWLRNTNLCAFGIIGILSGVSGRIDTLLAGVSNLITAPVNYLTSLTVTATNLAAAINSNSINSGYKAVSIVNYVVIISTTPGASQNGVSITGTATTLTIGNSKVLANGKDSILQALSVQYNLTTDRIRSCYDNSNNIVTCTNGYAGDPFNNFPWGDSRYSDNIICSSAFNNNFLYDPNTRFWQNVCLNESYFANNFFSQGVGSSYAVFYNRLDNASKITNNVYNYTSTVYAGMLSYNQLFTSSSISGNVFTGTATVFAFITGNVLSGSDSTISNNIIAVINVQAAIQYNSLIGQSSSIKNNTAQNGCKIVRNNLIGFKSSISGNIFGSSVNTSTTIQLNTLIGSSSIISAITLDNVSVIISNNFLNGDSSSLKNCIMNGSSNKIINVILNGSFSSIDSFNFNSIGNALVNDIVIHPTGAILAGIIFTNDFFNLKNIEWGYDTYKISCTKIISGAINNGKADSIITMSYVPIKFFPTEVYIEASGIVGLGSMIRIGIDQDADNCIMPDTSATTLNNVVTNGTIAKTKSTALRKIILTPTVADITAGTVKLILKGAIGI